MICVSALPSLRDVFAAAARMKRNKIPAREERASDPPQVATIDSVAQTLLNPRVKGSVGGSMASRSRRFEAPDALGLWHLTSLDAPTVAMVWSLGFAWMERVRLPVWIPVLLALAAWAVYIVDRLLDVRGALRLGDLGGLRERHRFHHRHRRLLIPLAIAAACAAAAIVFTLMPAAARDRNSVLAVAALAYFTRVHSNAKAAEVRRTRVFKKELLVGVLFTVACALPAFSRAQWLNRAALIPFAAAVIFFALLAWLNCHAIERWESGAGEARLGEARLGHSEAHRGTGIPLLGCLLALAGLLAASILSFIQPRVAALLCAGAASALLLALLDRVRARMTPLALRAGADLVLLTPLLLLEPQALLTPLRLLLR